MNDELLGLDAGRPKETMTLVLHPERHPELVALLRAAVISRGTLKLVNLTVKEARFSEPPELNTWWNGDAIECKFIIDHLEIR